MSILFTVLLFILGIIVVLLIAALLMKKDYEITCEYLIPADKMKLFHYISMLKNQDHFNKWVMAEPDMNKSYRGKDGEIGFIYAWKGTKAGEGELELTGLKEGEYIKTEIRFVKPFVSIAYSNYYFKSESEQTTKITWTNKSKMVYPMNVLLPMVKNMLEKDMYTSLGNLEKIMKD